MAQQGNVDAVEKTLRLIENLSEHNGNLTLAQLAQMLDCSISSADRFLHTLRNCGYAQKNLVTGKYELTNKLFLVSYKLLDKNDTLQELVQLAHEVSQTYNVSVNINAFCNREPLMLFRLARFHNKDLEFKLGQSAPAYCTSSGKAMLSQLSSSELNDYFANVRIRSYQGEPVTEELLRKELAAARSNGYAVCSGEYVAGIFSISFPVKTKSGSIYAFTVIVEMKNWRQVVQKSFFEDIKKRLSELLLM